MPRNTHASRPLRLLTAALVVVALTGACGSNDDPQAAASESATSEPTSTTGSTETSAPTTSATVPPTTTSTTTTTPPLPELDLIGAGPYPVGVSTITVDDGERGRPLTVDVWFPLDPAAVGDPQQYPFLPGVYYESPSALTADFADIAGDGPYPLVLYSHGSGGLRYIHSRYTETIASHGYVVAAPDHTGNTAIERILESGADMLVTAVNRPNDVTAVIDELVDPESTVAAGLTEHIDAERIVVTGHSFGGFTAYAMVSGYENPNGRAAADDRVDAVITLAPAANELLLSDDQLAAVDVPSLVIVGTDDKTTPIEPNVTRPWELSPGTPAYRVELLAAEHQTFTDVCAYLDFLPTLEVVPDLIIDTLEEFGEAGCQPDDMPSERAQQLTNTFALTFLDEVLRGGPPIDPAAVEFPDDVRVEVRPG